MSRIIDHIDDYIQELIDSDLDPATAAERITFNVAHLRGWLIANTGYAWTMPEVSQLLQDHAKAQKSGKPPVHTCYTLNRGPNAVWGVGHAGAVTFITSSAISRAAKDAVNRITCHAQPAAVGDPRGTELIKIAQKQIENQLGGLAEMLAMLP